MEFQARTRSTNPSFMSGPEKNSLNIKFWAGYSWDIRDPDVGISRTKTLCKWPFSVVLDRKWPGCPGIWGRDVPDLEKLYARKLWDDFSHPIMVRILHGPIRANRIADSRESPDSRESFQGSRTEPSFLANRALWG